MTMETNWYRTDLIDESEEMVQHRTKQEKEALAESSGIELTEKRQGRVQITEITVDDNGAKAINKKSGTYITLSVPALTAYDEDGFQHLENVFIDKLNSIHEHLNLSSKSTILIIGLGNRTITPDAVGPYTIDRLQDEVMSFLDRDGRMIVYAPGVTGQTGYETSEFVYALSEGIKPDLILVIDALAARSSSRLCRTIQLTDTGIHPGSGVGNERKEVSKEVMGVPVTAIGVPTVVDGPVMISDALETVFKFLASKIEEANSPSSRLSVTPWLHNADKEADRAPLKPIFGELSQWSKEEKLQLFEEVLSGNEQRIFVTPKDTDQWIFNYATMISSGITKWMSSLS